jgi:cell division protease FtsH
MQLPVDDKHTYTRDYLEGQIAIMMGGRVAEETFLNHMTTGAGNDFEQATELARRMVCDYGMSSLGPLTFGKREEQIFLGREIAQHRDYSEDTAIRIDHEIKRFVNEGYDRAKQILGENRNVLIRIADNLLEREVLDANEVKQLIQGFPLVTKGSAVSSSKAGNAEKTEQQVVQSLTPSVTPLVDKQREKPAPA